jgi:hypothetical protein
MGKVEGNSLHCAAVAICCSKRLRSILFIAIELFLIIDQNKK